MLRIIVNSFAFLCITALPAFAVVDVAIEQDEPRITAPMEQKITQPTQAHKPVQIDITPAKKPLKTSKTIIPIKKPSTIPPTSEAEATPYLPPFKKDDLRFIGENVHYKTQTEDTLLDIARYFGLGFVELQATNTDIDPWAIMPETDVALPLRHILPRAEQEGIIVNLSDMRIYFFKEKGKPPITFPVGIGREGLNTPQGKTKIIRKKSGPSWHPTARMRAENPDLPLVIPAGPSNPLGTHALYLGWPTFLIHGTNKPWGIGRRVSSGCMRMYPEDIAALYEMTPTGTKVQIVEQAVKMAWYQDALYLEIHPEAKQTYRIEETGHVTNDITEIPEDIKSWIRQSADTHNVSVNWGQVKDAYHAKQGTPIQISQSAAQPETNQRVSIHRQFGNE